MQEVQIQCHFCFETFWAYLGVDGEGQGAITEIYDCDVCCHPNRIRYEVVQGEVRILEVSDGNE